MPPEEIIVIEKEIIVIEKEIETVTVLSETIAGPQGLPGGSILYGSGAPNNSLGNAGDSYIDTDVGDLYAKDQIGWNLELS
ncbi:MAG TPA: hypothetical protein PKN93_17670, partial [Leptospiraceae bacterium]|nr:hypothetical protein [Anaerolineales bacterium]HNN76482.1 hypothetical protein [Leptospiraceae bacterium]